MGPKKDGKKKKIKDPDKPKRAMTAYFYYAKHCREKLAQEGKRITKVGDFTKDVSAKWRVLTDEEKTLYNTQAAGDKKRYEAQMEIFRPKKDPKKKRAATPYFHFLAVFRKRPECKSMHIKDISKNAGATWRGMSDAEKDPFKQAYEKQKKELAELQAAGDAGGAAAAPPPPLPPPPPPPAAIEDDDEEYDDDEDDDDEDDDE